MWIQRDGGNGHLFCRQPSHMIVRYVHAVLFLLANIVFEVQRRSSCHGDHDCLAAIRSEPETDCYKKEKAGACRKTMMSFVFELTSTAASAFPTGNDYKCIQFRNAADSEDNVFFHFVSAMGSMYLGMLSVGWDTHHIMGKWSIIDVHWTSAWVHIVNEGQTVISSVAIPSARKYRIDWLRQLLAWIFGIGARRRHGPEQ